MTTLAELVELAPVATHGVEIDQFPATLGSWRFALELADPLAGVDVEWHDLTAYYMGDMADRGADQYAGRYRAMTVELDLLADNDDLAPWLAATPAITAATVSLDAGLLMRLSVFRVTTGSENNVLSGADDVVFGSNDVVFGASGSGTTVEWHPLWTGRVETWGEASAARGQIRTHRVTIVDLIGDLVNVPVGPNVEEFWEVRIANLLADAGWSFGYDTHGKADLADIPIRAEQTSAINEIDATTDPTSVEWRTRRNGRLVFHPAAYDETHDTGGTWPNPLLDTYPAGLVFSYSPDFTDIEYVADDDVESFGIERTSLGVINNLVITMPGGVYPIDDPTSIEKYGTKPYAATWIVDNEPAADQILSSRAFATAQALPMTTTVDHNGFFPAMAMVDHLDPVTIYWQPRPGGYSVTAVGSVRHITERRAWRREGGISWETTLQFDITSTVESDASLLPPEDLELGVRTSSSIEWLWTNPGGQPIEPTETQVRMVGHSLIWTDIAYPLPGITFGGLAASTTYTFQVRYVRRVDGIITHFSPITESFPVSTLGTAPGPGGEDPDGDDPGDTEVVIPDLDPECDLEWELQENDGTGWVTIDSGDQDDLIDNGDGTYSLDIDESVFEPGKTYRVRSREVCDGVPGDWQDGPSWDPPDDWSDPCTVPPQLSDPPYDEASLEVYVPKVCAPDTITEAVSGIAGVHGPAY